MIDPLEESAAPEHESRPHGSNPSDFGAAVANLSPGRISIPEIAKRLHVGRIAVYAMLEQGLLPGVRLGRRWIVTRHAFEQWERTCGTGFQWQAGGNV